MSEEQKRTAVSPPVDLDEAIEVAGELREQGNELVAGMLESMANELALTRLKQSRAAQRRKDSARIAAKQRARRTT